MIRNTEKYWDVTRRCPYCGDPLDTVFAAKRGHHAQCGEQDTQKMVKDS